MTKQVKSRKMEEDSYHFIWDHQTVTARLPFRFPSSLKHPPCQRLVKESLKEFRYHNITISQNSWDWKGPLEVNWSIPPTRARPPKASCSGPWSQLLWILSRWLWSITWNGDSINSLCQCQCSVTPSKKVPDIQREHPVLVPPVLSLLSGARSIMPISCLFHGYHRHDGPRTWEKWEL